jgi:hypothetical protein
MTMQGAPPGTRWLKQHHRPRRHKKASLHHKKGPALHVVHPKRGEQQYGVAPEADGTWSVMGSSPESDEWDTVEHADKPDLDSALEALPDKSNE